MSGLTGMRFYLSSIAMTLLLSSCIWIEIDKAQPQPQPSRTRVPQVLPAATHEGLNTFGCRLNGKVWLPELPSDQGYVTKVTIQYREGYFTVWGARQILTVSEQDTINETLVLNLTGCDSLQTYQLSPDQSGNHARFNEFMNGCTLDLPINSSWVKITHFDPQKRIIAGRFAFILLPGYNYNGCDTLRCTDGRFDVSY